MSNENKATDLTKVRNDLEGIEVVLEEYPDIGERTLSFLMGELEEGSMANETQVSLRLPAAFLEEAERLVPYVAQDSRLSAIGEINRSAVLRLALVEGLNVLASYYKTTHNVNRNSHSV